MADSKQNTMATRVQDTVKQEIHDVASTANAGVRSGAYIYPFRGIFYFLTHRSLWKPLLNRLIPTMTLGLGVTAAMFLFTYAPQLAILFFTQGPLAAVTTALLVLSESSTITQALAKSLLIEDSLVDTFDGTLLARGQTALVQRDRTVKSGGAGETIARLGKLARKPFEKFAPSAMVRYVMYLPLNFIPVVGTAMFVVLQGKKLGPNTQARYFQLKNMSKAQREQHIEERRGAYTGFGVAGVLLEMVPVAGIMFAFTNVCGAALWAADMEKSTGAESTQIVPDSQKKAA